MRANLILLSIVTIGILAATAFLNKPTRPSVKDVPIETTQTIQNFPIAPNVSLTDIAGNTYRLHDFKGKNVLLNFWASWCSPCLAEFPQLFALTSARQDSLTLIAVSVDAEKENISKFFNKLSAEARSALEQDNVHIIWDPEKIISQETFQTIRYPETLIIAPDMTLRQKIIGASVDFSSEEFIQQLEDAVK